MKIEEAKDTYRKIKARPFPFSQGWNQEEGIFLDAFEIYAVSLLLGENVEWDESITTDY